MAEEAPALKRDSTMTVTVKVGKINRQRANKEFIRTEFLKLRAKMDDLFLLFIPFQEGEAFLEEHAKVHAEAKTRAQQKEIEESEEDASMKVKRTSTMAATAQVNDQNRESVSLISLSFVQKL